jgi:alkanesulfonate monooxygenase SsuD/methylene tetrahydromethanopterin reductase-like flavin-dependent oxidoreductase (luciferase family)
MASITPKVGITTYNYPPQELINLARTAERLGFEGLWFGEHYVIPGAYGSKHPGISGAADHKEDDILSPSVRLYDPWFTLGAIAGATTTLKLGTAICILPIMHPLLLARATATAHDVSGGRFRLGMGAGWLKEEFEALGVPFEECGRPGRAASSSTRARPSSSDPCRSPRTPPRFRWSAAAIPARPCAGLCGWPTPG